MSKTSSAPLLFVECEGATGRPSRVIRPLLNRHVMANYLTNDGYHGGEIIFEDDAPGRDSASAGGAVQRAKPAQRKDKFSKSARDRRVVNKQQLPNGKLLPRPNGPAGNCPPPMKALNSSCYQRQEDIARWWFYCPDLISAPFQVAQYHWATAAWDLSRQSDIMFECVKLYAWRKRAQLTGNMDRYIAQQLALIRRIKDNVAEHGEHLESEPFALVAVGVLAYVALLDADLETSATHLYALRAFHLCRHFEYSRQGWLYMVWADFRFALISGTPPVLDYFIPSMFRQCLPTLDSEIEAKMLHQATRNSTMSPTSPSFDEVEMHSMFLKVHLLYHTWVPSSETQFALFGLLYDLEYRLRVIQARLRHSARDPAVSTDDQTIRLDECVELVLAAIQLHVWIVSRHWAPASSYSRQTVLDRACDLIGSVPASDLVRSWQRVGHIRSLVWCLATVTAFCLENGVDGVAPLVQTLQSTLIAAGVSDREGLSEMLQAWFWHDNWHPNKVELLWKATQDPDHLEWSAESGRLQKQKQRSCFYIGAVEFYTAA